MQERKIVMPINYTADQVWAVLNVSSISEEFQLEKNEMGQTQNVCTVYPCGTGYCNTKYATNCLNP